MGNPPQDERRATQAEEDERLTAAADRRRRTSAERPPANANPYVAPYRPPQPRLSPSSDPTVFMVGSRGFSWDDTGVWEAAYGSEM